MKKRGLVIGILIFVVVLISGTIYLMTMKVKRADSRLDYDNQVIHSNISKFEEAERVRIY
jgi:predicted Holliday junction resolvase-like endonuclease